MLDLLGVRPSHKTGFAQYPGMSEYPQLWMGLVGAWDASLGQTGSRLIDWSGKGNEGIFGAGAASPIWVGDYLSFDGGDYVNCNSAAGILNVSTPFSFTTQFKCTDLSATTWHIICEKGLDLATDTVSYMLVTYGTSLRFYIAKDASNWATAATTIVANTWYTATCVWDGVNIHLYLDGVWQDSDPAATIDVEAALPFVIGSSGAPGTYFLQGGIKDLYFYNRILIPAEIALLHQIRKQLA